jgi:hypothetical protein
MKTSLIAGVLLVGTLCLGAGNEAASLAGHRPQRYEITFMNITHGMLLTPPIISLSRRQIDVYEVGAPATLGLEMLAEGGLTDELRSELEAYGLQDVIQTMGGVMPGQSTTVQLEGDRWSRLNLASMLVPTNDGFVAMNGPRVWRALGAATFYLSAHDAGTEENDELCGDIPGPQCGGEGFNSEDGEGFVAPHPGIHGEGDLSRQTYNWGEPVARVTVRTLP